MKLNEINGVYQLSDKNIEVLNSYDSVDMFPKELKTPTLSKKVSVVERNETGGRCAISNSLIKKGEIICYGDSSRINKPIKYSWQITEDIHLIGPGLLDHNCIRPTCIIDDNNNFIASQDIEKGELITFNYLTTEYDMNEPFQCKCNEEKCFGKIRGFKYLDKSEKNLVIEIGVSNYIKKIMT